MAMELWRPYQGYGQPIFVVIAPGTHRATIATQLAGAGVIRSRFPFVLICLLKPKQTLKAGEYYFQKPLSPYDVFEKLARGEVYQHTLAILEGLTMFEIARQFEREGLVTAESFLGAARDVSLISDLAPEAPNLEGYLFPDTYSFPMGVSPHQIVATMVQRFRQVFDQFGPHGRNPYSLSVHGLVTMASLVEKETSNTQERFLVAGVFYNRLRRQVALQCDPTVIYAARLLNRFGGTIDRQTLAIRSPYNTYRNRGLPPGPIANPGKSSLEAALYPPYVDYLYFVSNTRGGHFFGKTLAQHSENVARYRHLLAQQALAQAVAQQSGRAEATPPVAGSGRTATTAPSQATPRPPKKLLTPPQPPKTTTAPQRGDGSVKNPKSGRISTRPPAGRSR